MSEFFTNADDKSKHERSKLNKTKQEESEHEKSQLLSLSNVNKKADRFARNLKPLITDRSVIFQQ